MARTVNELPLALCIGPPKDKHQMVTTFGKAADSRIGECLPSVVLMRGRSSGIDREGGVEQQNTLTGPETEVARRRRLTSEVS